MRERGVATAAVSSDPDPPFVRNDTCCPNGSAGTLCSLAAVSGDGRLDPVLVAFLDSTVGSASQFDPTPPLTPAICRCCCSIMVTQ